MQGFIKKLNSAGISEEGTLEQEKVPETLRMYLKSK